MIPTENLVHEHIAILEVLDVIGQIAENIKQKKVFYPTDVEEIADFLINFWDKYHSQKEEKMFSSEVILSNIQEYTDLVDGVPSEHVLGRIYIREMTFCIENCKIGNTFSCERLADCLMNYSNMLRRHMEIEEKVLFPIINQRLSVEEQKKIMSDFYRTKDDPFGWRIHQKYFEVAGRLKNKYVQTTAVSGLHYL